MSLRASTLITTGILLACYASSVLAADPAIKCEAGKLKEAAKYGSCRLKADAKAAATGLPADYSKCELKFTDKWDGLENTAGVGVCPSEEDRQSMNTRIVLHAADVAVLLAGGTLPVCGNGVREAYEQCDGPDLDSKTCLSLGYGSGTLGCTPECAFDFDTCSPPVCAPPATCGNGVVDPGEECDWGTPVSITCQDAGFLHGEMGCDPATCLADSSTCFNGCDADTVGAEFCLNYNTSCDCWYAGAGGTTIACYAALLSSCSDPGFNELCAEGLNESSCAGTCCP